MQETTKTIYVTDDGTEFEDRTEAAAHEAAVNAGDDIANYLETLRDQYKQRTLDTFTKVLTGYESWVIINHEGE